MVLKLTVSKIQIIWLNVLLTSEKSNFMGSKLVWDLEKAIDDIQIFKIIDAFQNFAKKWGKIHFCQFLTPKVYFNLRFTKATICMRPEYSYVYS